MFRVICTYERVSAVISEHLHPVTGLGKLLLMAESVHEMSQQPSDASAYKQIDEYIIN